MSFPLDIRTDLFIGGTWQDISPDVYLREVKNIVRGLRDQGSTADPTSLSLTLNNRAGKYSPRNAMSPLYGMIGRNTPLRVSVPGDGESYLQLDGRDGNYASTPDAADLDLTGDLDVRAEISPNWYGSNNQLIIGKWDRANRQQSWVLQISDAILYFRFSTTADADVGGRFFGRRLPQLPERAAVRATLDIDNGNGGNTVKLYWAESLDAPNGWTQIGTTSTVTAGTDPIYSGTAPLSIGMTDLRDGLANPRYPMNGRGHRFEVRNGIDGPVVASVDFRSVAPGSTSLVDSQGRTWTLSGSAEVRDRADRFVGEVASWPVRWSTDDADIWTPITANGILRRLGQGAKALDSTLRRRIPSGYPIAYWPMEELSDAVQAYSPIPGVQPASLSSVDWASFDTLPSSAPLPRLTGTSSLSAPVPAAEPGEWHVEMVYNADKKIPLEDVEFLKILSNDGTIRRWEILKRNARVTIQGFDAANTRVIYRWIIVGADIFEGWTRFRFYCEDLDDGTFSFRIAWQDPGGDSGGYTNTYTGTCGSVSMISADWPALTEGWGVGHLAVLDNAGSGLYTGSDNAYSGEYAHTRMCRLAIEEDLVFTQTAGRFLTERVGYQRRDSLLSLLETAADADGGLLTEDMTRIGLRYRDRASMYAQEPAFTLSYTAPGMGPDLEPVDDDSAVVNDVTVQRDGGSSGRAVLEQGPLSIQPAPDGIGKYDASYTVSLAEDNQAEPHAHWRLHKGTWDAARFPTVSLLLHKPGAEWLIPLVRNLREGDKIRLTDLPEWLSHDDVDLIVLGWTERLDMYRWELDLNCVPAGPWDTAVTDAVKADTDGAVVATSATDTATSLVVRTTDGPLWVDDPEFLPYDIRVSGETMRVKSVGALVDTGDPYFTTGAAGWTPTNSTVTWQNGFTLPNGKTGGVISVTPNGTSESGDGASVLSATGSIVAGRSYRVGMWVYAPNGLTDFRPGTYNYNSAGTYLGTSLAAARAIPAGQWTWTEYDFVGATNTVRGKVRGRWGGTAPAQPFYIWGARLFAVSGQSVADSFTRTASSSWGVSDSGHAWQITGGAAASNFSVNGSAGLHSMGTRNLFYTTSLPSVALQDVEFESTFTVPVVPTGDGVYTYTMVRTDASTSSFYFARVWCKTSGVAELSIRKRVPTESTLATYSTTLPHVAGQSYKVRISAVGSTISAKFWRVQDAEPTDWQLSVTDSAIAGPGGVGVRSYISSTNTNTLPVVVSWGDVHVTDSQVFAVTRSLNGVVKAQPAGTSVSIANPAVVSL